MIKFKEFINEGKIPTPGMIKKTLKALDFDMIHPEFFSVEKKNSDAGLGGYDYIQITYDTDEANSPKRASDVKLGLMAISNKWKNAKVDTKTGTIIISESMNEGKNYIEVGVGSARKAAELLNDEMRGSFKATSTNVFEFKREDDLYNALYRFSEMKYDVLDSSYDNFENILDENTNEGFKLDTKIITRIRKEFFEKNKDLGSYKLSNIKDGIEVKTNEEMSDALYDWLEENDIEVSMTSLIKGKFTIKTYDQ